MAVVIRKILDVDMDDCFASVELGDNLSLRGSSVAVGHAAPHGLMTAASYEAGQFEGQSAPPTVSASPGQGIRLIGMIMSNSALSTRGLPIFTEVGA